ncbi:RrF2 family transcriptional regulator [Schinkia azotoformans]|uniref:RrF2 family transcriptional regulator n=1 Tax=Schinkia azotoformans TaxID=1454 RepID=UPI002DBA7202|nr:Rrf2 family transcriptional regulator [Schinkia azotoformans]MEC1759863.1 Rrf2 family transcriptional regulator [Schinkia azotoformans]
MQYSVGVEYALHCLLYLINPPTGSNIGIKELSKFQGVSETYLSKIFTKLAKADIVRAVPGVKGGYQLTRKPSDISFWDVVEAIEGSKPMFQCKEIRQGCILYQETGYPDNLAKIPCKINVVMLGAEKHMRDYLKEKSLLWLFQDLEGDLPEEFFEETKEFFKKD